MTAKVLVGSDSGGAGSEIVASCVDALSRRLFCRVTSSAPLVGTGLLVQSATPVPVNISGTVYTEPRATRPSSEIQAEVTAAIGDLIRGYPLGGRSLSSAAPLSNKFFRNDLIAAVESVQDVRSVVLDAPGADVSIGVSGVATLGTLALVYAVAP